MLHPWFLPRCLAFFLIGLTWMGTISAEEQLRNPNSVAYWVAEQHETAQVRTGVDDGGICIETLRAGSEDWHVQVYQSALSMRKGATYHFRGEIRGEGISAINPYIGMAFAPYSPMTEFRSIPVTATWTPFDVTFTATEDGAARGPMITLGKHVGSLWLRNASVDGLREAVVELPIPAGWFPWAAGDGDIAANSALDASTLGQTPAGSQGRVVVRDGHFATTASGQRIRFFATNLGAGDCFIDADAAEALALRLQRAGINLVRLHHLDNCWSIATDGSLWDKNKLDRQSIDPKQRDRFDALMAALIRHGIYLNINCKVSKDLTSADGFPESISKIPTSFQKRIDFFDERMITLQQNYARDLLTHVNPYTGRNLIDEAAVASVEINNENSFVGFWTNELGKDLDQMPDPFRSDIAAAWTQWLKAKYTTDAALRAAWNAGIEPLGKDILTPGTWSMEQRDGGVLSVTDADAGRGVKAVISAVSGTAWHLQIHRREQTLKADAWHTLSFRIKADHARAVFVTVGQDREDWHNMGLDRSVPVTTEWQTIQIPFLARATVDGQARIAFHVGQAVGTIEIADLALHIGSDAAGLLPTQSLASGLPIPTLFSPAQHADWIAFIASVDRRFADRMRDYLRKDLGVTAPITVSQIDYGGTTSLYREMGSDFIDAHGYWQHPNFTGRDWDNANWVIGNTAQLDDIAAGKHGLVGSLAWSRVAGLPYTISEYDHPAPNDFACEMLPEVITMAARQDWDAIYTFALSGSQSDGRMNGWFDQQHHPAKWGFYPAAGHLLRRGLIQPATATATITPPSTIWDGGHFFSGLWSTWAAQKPAWFDTHIAVHLPGAGNSATLDATMTPEVSPLHIAQATHGPVMTVSVPAASIVVGYIGGSTTSSGPLTVTAQPFGRQFAACTLIALDNDRIALAKRLLVTVVARAENQGMAWNEKRTSVGAKWGRGPVIVERVPGEFRLAGAAGAAVYALAPDGERLTPAVTTTTDGQDLVWKTTGGPDSIHFEIVHP
jgi:hypothetical protein